jgi:hypothetical protein
MHFITVHFLSENRCRAGRGTSLLALSVILALVFAPAFSASGTTMISGSLDLNNFNVTPSSGSIQWGTWTLSAFASVNNSNGDVDFDFQTGHASAHASASVRYASANSSANYPAVKGRFGHVDGMVNLPGGTNAVASVNPSLSTLETTFSIVGASGSGPVQVMFSALLSFALTAMTDATGTASGEFIFNMGVDGDSLLSFSDQVMVGPNGSVSDSGNPILTETITLDSSIQHYFVIFMDTDYRSQPVPDRGETYLLLLIGWSAVVVARSLLVKPRPATQRV